MKLWPEAPTIKPRELSSTQCPNCGAYGSHIGTSWRDLRSDQIYTDKRTAVGAQATGILFLFSTSVSYAVVTWLLGPDALWLALIAGGIVTVAILGVWMARGVRREIHSVRIFRYKCDRCLHEWDQQEGKPPPRFNEAREILEDYRAVFGTTKDE